MQNINSIIQFESPHNHIQNAQGGYYTPGKPDFTDVQRCLKCNGMGEGVSTWGPWTAASHWAIEPVYGYEIYSVTLTGIEAVTCLKPGYTGSSKIHDGGFIALNAGEEIVAEEIVATCGKEITVTVNKSAKSISVTFPYVAT